jgi:hypothetical protein
MSLATGVTRIITTDTSSETINFTSLADGVTIQSHGNNTTASTIGVTRLISTGTESQTFVLGSDDAGDNISITMADIETTNLSGQVATFQGNTYNNTVDVELQNVSMTAAGATNTVNFTGSVPFNIVNTNVDLATITANTMTAGGAVVMGGAARANTSAVNYTGSSGNDTFVLAHANDVMDGGAGSDTLDINYTAVLGGINIDLTAADQIGTVNGGGNTAIQTGFENIDVSGFNNFGAFVNGSAVDNNIIGTISADQINAGGASTTTVGNVITGGRGNDVITLGAGFDTILFNQGINEGNDTVTGFTSVTDRVDLQALGDASNTPTNVAAGFTIADNEIHFVGGGAAGDADGSAAAGGGTNVDDAANTNDAYFVVVDDNSTGVFFYLNNNNNDNCIVTAELTQVASIDAVLVIGDLLA